MSILVDRDTRLLVQGLTGKEGSFHVADGMEDAARQVVAAARG